MSKQPGKLMLLKIGDGADPEVFTTLGGLNAKTITINNNTYEITTANTTTPGGQVWRDVLTGIRSVTVSGNGYFDDSTQEERLRAVAMGTGESDTADAKANFQLIVPDFGTFEGPFHVDSLEYGGEIEDGVTYQTSLSSSGVITFTAA